MQAAVSLRRCHLQGMMTMWAKLCVAARVLLVRATAILVVALPIVHLAWQGSGTSQWRLVREEAGIKIFTLKAPGECLLKVRASMQVRTSLTGAVALLREDPFADRDLPGAGAHVIEQIETPAVFLSYYSVRQQRPAPFPPAEVVVLINYSQPPSGRTVEVNVQAAPTKGLPTADRVRVAHLHHVVRLAALPDGLIGWEFSVEEDLGLPYPIANLIQPDRYLEKLKRHRQRVLETPYQTAQLISVREP